MLRLLSLPLKFEKGFCIMLRFIFAFLDFFIADETSSRQLALSAVVGMYFGFIPVVTLQWWILAVCVLVLRFNLAMTVASSLCFATLSLVLEPIFTSIGYYFLTHFRTLVPLWAWMHHAKVIPFTRFNNTYVFGSALVCIVLSTPVFYIMSFIILHCREGFYHFWKTTKLSRHYAHFRRYI